MYRGPQFEQQGFAIKYFEALSESKPLTVDEVQGLVVDLMAEPEKADFDPEISSVVEFVRATLKNASIPISWLTGAALKKAQKKFEELEKIKNISTNLYEHNDTVRLFIESGKVSVIFAPEVESILPPGGIKMLKQVILSNAFQEIPEKWGKILAEDMESFHLLVHRWNGHFVCEIAIYLKTGEQHMLRMHIGDLINFAKKYPQAD